MQEQGGALYMSSTGKLRVSNTSFDECTVAYSTEPICLTLTMLDTAGAGWEGAELFVFQTEDYHGANVVYRCPETCDDGGGVGSCDFIDFHDGTKPNFCDSYGAGLPATYGCDCSGCVCGGFDPPVSSYLHRFSLADGFSATEELCFDRGYGQGQYTILVTEDKYPGNIQWTLEGYVLDGAANDVRHLDFTTLESKEGCDTPGTAQRVRLFR